MKWIDMTHDIEEDMPVFNAKWHVHPVIKKVGDVKDVGRNTSSLFVGSHSGTHMDAPLHFVPDGNSIEQLDLNVLCGPVTALDFTKWPEGRAVEAADLSKFQISERILFVFGWDKKWKTDKFYRDYPYFGQDAARYLIEQGVRLVAMDTPSPDDSRIPLLSERDSEIHKIFLQHGVVLVEYLANTYQLDFNRQHEIYALPLKWKGSDGSPARVVVREY